MIFLPAFDVPTQQLGEQSYNLLFNLIAGEKGLQNITIGTQILLTDFLI
ncbi:LacI family transcription regulator [Klebsiella pneumoniae ATCC BAA-2146]|nr:LacI family transcription regulator [Klebsiella pneumoniae ATCC BAA-2146]